MTTRIVFMGSPDFALPSLWGLVKDYKVVGVITQPDRPAGRGRQLTPPPVKLLAQELEVPLIQPRRLSQPEAMQQLHEWAPELIVVAAFGQILRSDVLQLPKYGCINVHASLLPRWRGAAPIQAAILHGDERTGITIMRMDEGIDTGPIINQCVVTISPEDTSQSLSMRLAQAGAELLLDTLPAYIRGELSPTIQPDSGATYASMLKKEDGLLDFSQGAEALVNRVRAYNPWPGAFIYWKGAPMKIHRAHAQPSGNSIPGLRKILQGFPAIETHDDTLILEEVQPAGKKSMSGDEFLRGAHDWVT